MADMVVVTMIADVVVASEDSRRSNGSEYDGDGRHGGVSEV